MAQTENNVRKSLTTCSVKVGHGDEWNELHQPASGRKKGGFICKLPALKNTPPTPVVSPTDKEEVLKRLQSEEGRIGSRKQLRELHELVKTVYNTRMDPFEWDLRQTVELHHRASISDHGAVQSDGEEHVELPAQNNDDDVGDGEVPGEMEYELDSMAAVRYEGATQASPFWIGKVRTLEKDEDGCIASIALHWYEPSGSHDVFDAPYYPSYHAGAKKSKKKPWTDEIVPLPSSSHFQASQKKRRIPSEVAKMLRGPGF